MQAGVRLLEDGHHFIKPVNVPRIQNGGWLELQQQGELSCLWDIRLRELRLSWQNCRTALGRISVLRQQHHRQEANFLKETEGVSRDVCESRQNMDGWTEGLLAL